MKRTKWDYLVSHTEEELAQLGQEGWELVSVVPVPDSGTSRFYYKRPAPTVSECITLEQRSRVLKEGQEA
ncbi:MAG: hypothetical protein K0Q90_2958 [Paenibacillaceae bacterium]|nr:hypothetical protein [Paenibacillaceae bacterium]